MSPTERLRALAKDDMEAWYPTSFDREEEPDMYEFLATEADPLCIQRLGTCEYRIELCTEDKIYVMYRHLDEL